MAQDSLNYDIRKYGEPLTYDKSFKGPREKRSCTDVFWLLIFIIFLGGWCYISYYAIKEGDLNTLLIPTDSLNQKCGVDSPVIKKPYLFFFDLQNCFDPLVPIYGCPTPQVCIENCPSETFIFDEWKNKGNIIELREKLICTPDIDKSQINSWSTAENLVKQKRCAKWYVKSKPLSMRCIPNDKEGIEKVIREINIESSKIYKAIEKLKLIANVNGFAQKLYEDVSASWAAIFVGLFLTLIASLIFISIMRWIAGPLVWFSICTVLVALGFGVYYTVNQYIYWKTKAKVPQHSPNLESAVKNIFQDENSWLVLAIILGVALIVIALITLVLRKRISVAVALIKEGSKAVSTVFSTIFFPIFPFTLHICVIIFSIAIGLYLASVGEPSYKILGSVNEPTSKCICSGGNTNGYTIGSSCKPYDFQMYCKENGKSCLEAGCYFEKIQNPKIIQYFEVYNVVAFIWVVFFISAFGEMVLAATFAKWYWTFHKSDVPYFILTQAMARTVRYHLGTLAFGSLILTICRLIRMILEYIEKKLKKFDNEIAKCIFCCCKCFFWLLEKFLRFLNKNAYIMCAIHGKNFCRSAKDAFNLLMRNFLRVVTIDCVTDFLFFMSKLFLTLLSGTGMYFYMLRYIDDYQLHYIAVPVVILVIGTYLMTSVFFSVYSMAVDTLFLCFLEDSERNDGSPEKPFFMSKQLMKILGKHNQISRNQYN